jgi:hypothetical protein
LIRRIFLNPLSVGEAELGASLVSPHARAIGLSENENIVIEDLNNFGVSGMLGENFPTFG